MATVGKRLFGKIGRYATMLGAVGQKHRFGIIFLLSRGEMDLSDLADALNLDKPGAIHHLRILKKNGWVIRTKSGRKAFYRLVPHAVKELKKIIEEMPEMRDIFREM